MKIADDLKPLAVSLKNLKPMDANPRKGDVDAVVNSYTRFGQRKPIVARKTGTKDGKPTGVVIAGNHQFLAAKKLGWDEIAVVWTTDDEATARAFAVADNRTGQLGDWDVANLVASLSEMDNDLLKDVGFTLDDVDDFKALIEEVVSPSARISTHSSERYDIDEQGYAGTRHTPSIAEYAERYATAATRVLMCDYPNTTYIWLIEQLAEIRKAHDLNSNAEAIIKLVEDVTGTIAPKEN